MRCVTWQLLMVGEEEGGVFVGGGGVFRTMEVLLEVPFFIRGGTQQVVSAKDVKRYA